MFDARGANNGEEKMGEINRRGALRTMGASLGAILTCGVVENARGAEENVRDAAIVDGVEAWKYAIVDPDKVAADAYADYHTGRCMYTTFKAIVANVADALEATDPLAASALRSFPFHMMRYGDAGANGWGSLCGALNGAMAAIGLFASTSATRAALCDELGSYYERTMLPIFKPSDADESEVMPQTISDSVLCHVSSGKWAKLAQVRTDSPERTERCSRLSADIAKKTVEILNLNIAALNAKDVKPIVEFQRPEPTATCVACHDKKGTNADSIGKMTCNECHPEKTPEHHNK